MLALQVCQNVVPNLGFMESMCAALPAVSKTSAFEILTQPSLDDLASRWTPNQRELAKSVFSQLSLDSGNSENMNCDTLGYLFRRVMLTVHPDKQRGSDKEWLEFSNLAASNLNNALEAVGC